MRRPRICAVTIAVVAAAVAWLFPVAGVTSPATGLRSFAPWSRLKHGAPVSRVAAHDGAS